MSDPTKPDEFSRPRGERLDVVLVKNGVAAHTAKPEDLRRVTVIAEDTFAASTHEDVEKAKAEGWTFLQVCKPGHQNEFEGMAARRAQGGLTDRTKI